MRSALIFALLLIPLAQAFGAPGDSQFNSPADFPDGFDDSFEDEFASANTFDPLSGYNRAMTDINHFFYTSLLFPVAKQYEAVIPVGGRRAIARFYDNLGFPARFINNLLQGKLQYTANELYRFVVNSSLGVAGLFDPAATRFGIDPHDEDFGQTLGHYGVGGGFHIVLPLLGPSNLRDTLALAPGWYTDPVTYFEQRPYNLLDNADQAYLLQSLRIVNESSFSYPEYESWVKDAIDLYPFNRNIYEQSREKDIAE